MSYMIDIHELMPRFCKTGDRALAQYSLISGEDSDTAPEYFMSAFIMCYLGNQADGNRNQLTITLETTFRTLWQWNSEARHRNGRSIPADLVKLGEELGTQKVDMVLFSGPDGTPKSDHEFLALVEFKRGNLETPGPGGITDHEKLLGLLKFVDTCPYGIVCGWIKQKYLADQKSRSDDVGDKWFQAEAARSEYVFCARIFPNPAFKDGAPGRSA
jgi:hypothetical protein